MRRRKTVVLAVAGGSIAFGWLALAHGAPAAPDGANASASAETARRAGVVASFDGGRITVGELEDVIGGRLRQDRVRIAAAGGREHLLDELIRYDVLVHEAELRGYHEHPLVIETAGRAAIERMVDRELRVQPSAIPADEVARYHEAHREEQSRPGWRRASSIDLASEAEARAAIAELKGKDRIRFAEVARTRGRDPRIARQGGELGYFDSEGKRQRGEASEIAKEVVAAVYALPAVGAISETPVAHDGVFSVVMFTGEMAPYAKTLAKLEPSIREKLADERTQKAIDALVIAVSAENKLEVHPELIDAIELEPAVPNDIPEGFPAAPPDPRAPPRLMKPDAY